MLDLYGLEHYTAQMNSSKVIDDLGGTKVVAELCELSEGAVSQWRNNGIPKGWVKYLQLLRPDVFGPAPESQAGQEATCQA